MQLQIKSSQSISRAECNSRRAHSNSVYFKEFKKWIDQLKERCAGVIDNIGNTSYNSHLEIA